MADEVWFRWQEKDLWLHIRVRPRANRGEFTEILNGQSKPYRLFGKALKTSKSEIEIIPGTKRYASAIHEYCQKC